MTTDGLFKPPGPGSWQRDSLHIVRPLSRWLAEIHPAALMRGFHETLERYGLLLEDMEIAVVGGFYYACPRPVGAPKGARGTPPRPVFWLMTRLHPEIRRRIRRSAEALERHLWVEDAARWEREWKPETMAKNRALQAVDPEALPTAELAAHLEACRARVFDSIYRHHSLNSCWMVSVGLWLVQTQDWTGLDNPTVLGLLRGSSPSVIEAPQVLKTIAEAIRGDGEARRLLDDGAPAGEILERLRAWPGAVGAAVSAYLDEVGYRLLSGYDVTDSYVLEVPTAVVGSLRSAVAGTIHTDGQGDVAERIARVREAVPAAHRATFDKMLDEARTCFQVHEERAALNDSWATGLARRALLAAGRRLVASGRLAAPDHAVDLTPAELAAALAGRAAPSPDEVAERVRYRTTAKFSDAPESLGPPPSPPPPAEWLPPPAARMQRAIDAALKAMMGGTGRTQTTATTIKLHGEPASPGRYEGVARVVLGPEAFARVQQGDVLIARMTCSSYNVLLPLLGGVVTERGGQLSHAATVAREYGLPAIVGTRDATRVITDGARVRIDGATGEVEVIA